MPTEWTIDGVRFTSRDSELVIRDHVDESTGSQLGVRMVFAAAFFFAGSMLLALGRDLHGAGLVDGGHTGIGAYLNACIKLLAIIVVLGAVTLAWARRAFGGHEVLRLTSKSFTITNVDFGVAWRTRSFLLSEIDDVEYAIVSSSDTSDIYAIQCRAGARRVRLFRYIKPAAAEEVVAAVLACRRRAL